MTTNQTVWVCIATYAPEDDIPPLCAVAFTHQEAAEQIDNVIHKHCKGSGVDPDMWIAHDPIERPVLPVVPPFNIDKAAPKVIVQELWEENNNLMADAWSDYVHLLMPNTKDEMIDDVFGHGIYEYMIEDQIPKRGPVPAKVRTKIGWFLPIVEGMIAHNDTPYRTDYTADDLKAHVRLMKAALRRKSAPSGRARKQGKRK